MKEDELAGVETGMGEREKGRVNDRKRGWENVQMWNGKKDEKRARKREETGESWGEGKKREKAKAVKRKQTKPN